MQVGHLEGAFLRLLARLVRARRILEIGTFTGYSALVLAEGLPAGGRLITCDVNPETGRIARRFWNRSSHGGKIRLSLGPALQTLRALKGPFDFIFIDADKENYIRYWDACLPKLRRGGLIAVDNVLWSGRVLAPRDATDRAIVAFNKRVARDRRVETVMLTLRDGVTLAWKK
jgi:caffeoyl-CoA O-methyltransferase